MMKLSKTQRTALAWGGVALALMLLPWLMSPVLALFIAALVGVLIALPLSAVAAVRRLHAACLASPLCR